MSQIALQLPIKDLTPAEWFQRRLSQHGVSVSPPAVSVADIRALILTAGFEYTVIGRAPDRRPETYAQAFERLFHEPLEAKKRKGK
jgi:hypothetical protein